MSCSKLQLHYVATVRRNRSRGELQHVATPRSCSCSRTAQLRAVATGCSDTFFWIHVTCTMWPTIWLPHSHKIWSTTEQAQYKQNMNSQTPHMTNIYICYHTMRYWEEGQGLIKRTETEHKRDGSGHSSRHVWHLIFLIFIPLGDTL